VAREETPRETSSNGQPPAVDDGGKQTSEQETLP